MRTKYAASSEIQGRRPRVSHTSIRRSGRARSPPVSTNGWGCHELPARFERPGKALPLFLGIQERVGVPVRQHRWTSRKRLSTASRDFRVRSTRRDTSSSRSNFAQTGPRQPSALSSRGSASRISSKRQRTFTVWNGYTGTMHSGSAHGRHRLPTTPAHRERACSAARA